MLSVSYSQIKALCSQKRLTDAVGMILHAEQQGLRLDSDSVAEALLLCANLKAIDEGRQLHALVRRKAVRVNRYLQNNLLNMYLKCGSLEEGQQFFHAMHQRDVVAWNVMIAGCAKSGSIREAIELFSSMLQENLQPNRNTLVCVLVACTWEACIEDGACIHYVAVSVCSLDSDVLVRCASVKMYSEFRRLLDAACVFNKMVEKDVFTWTSMITGCAECGCRYDVLCLFQQMLLEGVALDKIVLLSALRACAHPDMLRFGVCLHLVIISVGMDFDNLIGSALINMYAKCGYLHSASKVFEGLSVIDMVTWTALMSGYGKQGKCKEALDIFNKMLISGVIPGEATYAIAINSCAEIAAFDSGTAVHFAIVESGHELNIFVASALIDMYAKCGSQKDAHGVFHKLVNSDSVVWNAVIDGLARHGDPVKALGYFDQMKQNGVQVDRMTFVSVLSACNHAGLVEEGLWYFETMQSRFGIEPTDEVIACMVDIIGRAGHLVAANDFVQKLSGQCSISTLTSLLSACRVHKNADVAKCVVEYMRKLQPERESTYVLMSNVYALSETNNQASVDSDTFP